MNKLIYLERTETGYTNYKAIEAAILSFPKGKRLELIIKHKSNRSIKQNSYFHACVTILAKELGYSKEEMKNIVKYKFLKAEKVDEKTGEIFEYIKDTHALNKEDFFEFQNNMLDWSAQLGIILPVPNEEIEMNFDRQTNEI